MKNNNYATSGRFLKYRFFRKIEIVGSIIRSGSPQNECEVYIKSEGGTECVRADRERI